MTDSESPEELDLAKVAAVVEEAPATEATDETSSSSSEESKTSSTDETKPTATSTDKNDEGGGSGDATGTAIYAWASPTSGSMQVFDDKLNHVLLPGVSNGLTYVTLLIQFPNSLLNGERERAVQIRLSEERRQLERYYIGF